MKHTVLAGLVALSTLAASFAAPEEGHSYKVVNGQLVDVASTPQPQIVINNNIVNQPQPVQVAPVPEVQVVEVPSTHSWNFIVGVEKDLNDHNWRDLAPYLADGLFNYFGHRYTSTAYLARDMQNDAYTYVNSNSTYYTDTFTHEVSDEYSHNWVGPMISDSINVYSVVTERTGRVHRAMTRLTVSYTLNNGALGIYALSLKIL